MSYSITNNAAMVQQWLASEFTIDDVKKELQTQGLDETVITEQITEFKKQKLAKRQLKGFIYLSLGAFLGFASFLLTASNIMPQWHDFFLYGVTILSVIGIFIGLYFILEN